MTRNADAKDRTKLHTALAVGLFIATLLVFQQVRRFEFINYDDRLDITENPHVRGGLTLHNVGRSFTTLRHANYFPLTWISHMAAVEVFDLDPGPHHLVNAVIHAMNAAVAFMVLLSLTGATWKSLIVAALFTVHPLRMESVAWVAERKDVLCALFFLLAIGCYAPYARAKDRRWYVATAACFGLGALAKPMIVTLPFVLLLLDVWPLARVNRSSFRSLVVEKLPLFAIAIGSGVVTVIAQRAGGAMDATARPSVALRLGNAIWSYGRYLKKTVWPNDLAAFYPYPGVVPGTSFPWSSAAIAAIVLIAITAAAIMLWRRERAVLIGWLWFLGVLVPTIGLVQVGLQSMADRYSYLPHIGLFIAIVWGIDALAPRIRTLTTALAVVAMVAFAGCTMYQLRYWRDSIALFEHALAVTDHNATASACLAMALTEAKRPDDAIPYYLDAIRFDPTNWTAQTNLGNLLSQRGDTAKALAHLREAVRLAPDSGQTHNNLANALANAGQTDAAIAEYQDAIRVEPDLAAAHFNYGLTLAQIGKVHEAIPELDRAAQLTQFSNPRYLDMLAAAYAQDGQFDRAISAGEKALAVTPPSDTAGVEMRRQRLASYKQRRGFDRSQPATQRQQEM